MEHATRSYLDTILRHRPDEKAFLDSSLMGIGSLDDGIDEYPDDDPDDVVVPGGAADTGRP
jgi:hypothetical protein